MGEMLIHDRSLLNTAGLYSACVASILLYPSSLLIYDLHQGGHVFDSVCLMVCLFVSQQAYGEKLLA